MVPGRPGSATASTPAPWRWTRTKTDRERPCQRGGAGSKRRIRSLRCISPPPALAHLHHDEATDHDHAECDHRVDPEAGDEARSGAAAEVTGQSIRDPPRDSAECVPDKELGKAHLVDAGQPGGGKPHQG